MMLGMSMHGVDETSDAIILCTGTCIYKHML